VYSGLVSAVHQHQDKITIAQMDAIPVINNLHFFKNAQKHETA